MAFNPVRTPRIQGPDIGAAIEQGQGNALRSYQLREGIREVQGRNMLDSLAKRNDLTDAQKVETLNQSGRSDMAEKFKADQMKKAQYAMEGIKRGAMFVNDEESFKHWMRTSIDAGYSKPEKWIQNIGVDYEKAKPVLARLRGEKPSESKSYGPLETIPTAPDFVGQRELTSNEYKNVKREKTAPLVDMSGKDPYMKKRLEKLAERAGEITKTAESSVDKIVALDRFINKSDKAQQGGMQPVMTGLKNFFSSFGVDFESLKSEREMEQAVGDILANYMQELGARGLTDKDMEILRQALPRVNTDKESRTAIARILQKTYAKDIDEYGLMREQEDAAYPELKGKVFRPKWYKTYQRMDKAWLPSEEPAQPEAAQPTTDFKTMSNEELLDYLGTNSQGIGKVRIDERP